MPVFSCVVHNCKYLAATYWTLSTTYSLCTADTSWVHIHTTGSPEIRMYFHMFNILHWRDAFWNKTNHWLSNTYSGLARASAVLQDQELWQQIGTRPPELLCVAQSSRALQGLCQDCWKLHQPQLLLILESWLSGTSNLLLILQPVDNDTRDDSDRILLGGCILSYKAGASLITAYEHKAYAAILQESMLKKSIMLCHWAPVWQKSHSPKYQTYHL